jgi:hypothetical protein
MTGPRMDADQAKALLATLDPADVGAAASRLVAASIGDVVVVLSRSPAHKHHAIADIEWCCLPATFRFVAGDAGSKQNRLLRLKFLGVAAEYGKRLTRPVRGGLMARLIGRAPSLLLVAASIHLATPSARAASLERLGDGRVVITAFGERVAFPEKDAANVYFWWEGDCDPRDRLGTSLDRWLNDPKIAECLNRTIPSDVSNVLGSLGDITFQVTLMPEDGLLYPGAINPDEVSKSSMWPRSLSIVLRHPTLRGDCSFHDPGIADRLGYQRHLISVSPPLEEYTLKAAARIGSASRPLCVSCSQWSSVVCSSRIISGDKAVGVHLGWEQGDFVGPQPDWLKYDAATRKIARSIFIDRPTEDFQ